MTAYLETLSVLLSLVNTDPIMQAIAILRDAKTHRRRILTAGNGGSAATASHFSSDLFGVGICSICLNDSMPLLTRLSNDEGYEYAFSRQVRLLADNDDVLVLFSTSGLSSNILNARFVWQEKTTIGFTGHAGGTLGKGVKVHINVPSLETRQIEDVHLAICHMMIEDLEK